MSTIWMRIRPLLSLILSISVIAACQPIVTTETALMESAQPSSPVDLVRVIDTSAQQITNPASVAVDGRGNTYVADASENPRVLKYDKEGNLVTEWGELGSDEGQFMFLPPSPDAGPVAGFVAVDRQGNVYVSDAYNGRVQKFDPNGRFLMQFGSTGTAENQFDGVTGPLYVDEQNNIYVSTFSRVQKFDPEGNLLATYGTGGAGDGEFTGAAIGIIDNDGNMYMADLLNSRVQVLDSEGRFVRQWGNPGSEAGQFNLPVTIVQDSAGKLYVADNTGRIQIFDTKGNYLDAWDKPGEGYPALGGEISGLAVDGQDYIYVADLATPNIYVFHPRE